MWSKHHPFRVNNTFQQMFPPHIQEPMYFLTQVNTHYLHLIVSAPPFPGCFDECRWLYKHHSLYFSASLKPVLQLEPEPIHPHHLKDAGGLATAPEFLPQRTIRRAADCSLDATFLSMGAVKLQLNAVFSTHELGVVFTLWESFVRGWKDQTSSPTDKYVLTCSELIFPLRPGI